MRCLGMLGTILGMEPKLGVGIPMVTFWSETIIFELNTYFRAF